MNSAKLVQIIAQSSDVAFVVCLDEVRTMALLTSLTPKEVRAMHKAVQARASTLGLSADIDGNVTRNRLASLCKSLSFHVFAHVMVTESLTVAQANASVLRERDAVRESLWAAREIRV